MIEAEKFYKIRDIKKEKLITNAQKMSEYLFKRLRGLKEKYSMIKEVRGLGLMAGIELNIAGKIIVDKCLVKGLLINCTHERVLRLMPALNITKKEVDKALEILESVIKES